MSFSGFSLVSYFIVLICVDETGIFMYDLIRDPSIRRLLTFVWEMELPGVDKFLKLMVKKQLSRFFGITFADLVVCNL